MEKSKVIETLKALQSEAQERKFAQTYDMIVNLKGIDLKKTDQKVEFFHTLPKGRGREVKICALIGIELKDSAVNAEVDYILNNQFEDHKDKKKATILAQKYDYFIAQANLMGPVATSFGRVFGSRGKMPNPKAGCVVGPKANIEPVAEKLKSTVKIAAKTQTVCQFPVGTTTMSLEDVAENIVSSYEALIHHLPQEQNNVKNVLVKLTMSKAVVVGEK